MRQTKSTQLLSRLSISRLLAIRYAAYTVDMDKTGEMYMCEYICVHVSVQKKKRNEMKNKKAAMKQKPSGEETWSLFYKCCAPVHRFVFKCVYGYDYKHVKINFYMLYIFLLASSFLYLLFVASPYIYICAIELNC